MSVSPDTFTNADLGDNTVTLTVTDVNGNVSTCTSTVSVNDLTPPTAICQDITIQLDTDGNATIVAADIDNGSFDNSAIVSYVLSVTSFDCSNTGANTVTLTVTDDSGLTDSCTATVTVIDDTAPNAVCQDITIQLDASGAATITASDIDNGSSDNCSIATMTLDNSSFDCSDVGTNTVVLTVTDPSGNSTTCSAVVTVEDILAPNAICQNVTIQLDASGNGSITTGDIDNGSNDNCGIASITLDNTSFDCSNVGNNTVTLTVTDVNGNQSTCTATVTVEDNVAPNAICQDLTIQLDASGTTSISATDIDNGSNDNCGVASLSLDVTSFDCSNVGNNIVTLSVTDDNGNISTCTATVTVEDTTDPTLTCPADITVDNDPGVCNAFVSIAVPANSDNCGIQSLTNDYTGTSDASGTYPVGTTTVIWTLTDDNGNSVQCSMTVTVEDNENPTITCLGDQNVSLDSGCGYTLPDYTTMVTVNDNCTASPTVTQSIPAGTVITGPTAVTITVTDAVGNSNQCTINVIPVDDTAPTITCPPDINVGFGN